MIEQRVAKGGEKFQTKKICQFRGEVRRADFVFEATEGEVIPAYFEEVGDVSSKPGGEAPADVEPGVDLSALKFKCDYPGCSAAFDTLQKVSAHAFTAHGIKKKG